MVLVVGEQRGGKLNRATWEAVAAAQSAGGHDQGGDARQRGRCGGDRHRRGRCRRSHLSLKPPALAEYTADGYVTALASLIEQQKPSLVFFPHTYQTRDFAAGARRATRAARW